MQENISKLLLHFPIGTVKSIVPIEVGLIHKTYQVVSTQGSYCLQQIHSVLRHEGMLIDYERVTQHLDQKGMTTPLLVKTKEGKRVYQDPDSHFWRLITWIEGTSVLSFSSEKQVFDIACFLGTFHQAMSDFPFDFETPHKLHQTEHHLENLRKALQKHSTSEWFEKVNKQAQSIFVHIEKKEPSAFPQRVIHGDPKINNFLQNKKGEIISLIDLDTCNRHTILVELGDAFRSWCTDQDEEGCVLFRFDRWKNIVEGYLSCAPALTNEEIESLATCGNWISLELASRFLEDVLNDSYFAWDATKFSSRQEHNWQRALQMISLSQSMKQSKSERISFLQAHQSRL